MPKKSKKQDTSDSDSGPDDVTPAKKSKTESKSSKPKSEEENSWSLGKNRFVKLTEFKNTWYINIREYYNSDGELKPGKKGIMLTMEQWQKFKGCMDEIDEAIKKNV
ncbi:RNA polymerase II transcriptional coactivator [Diorhabda carinulata]|uniref:RNA polymerase II transcriptional coactivator n=1 Tax=Diorhabda sublineata TaxID=1163346 RepID=UPI0024E0E8CE|nr:RNA polymerase II transcriptional coactivator [Diorhabda sublineata]XP_057653209.1 RNA polymerase II transcriptional coactivator [Diorhabda carinulata]